MKTTLEVPGSLLRRVKETAARKGQTMGTFINLAIEAKLRSDAEDESEKPWMRFAGIFSGKKRDSKRVMQAVDEGCGQVHAEDWE